MKQILTVFSYTFKEGVRKKAFWISTIVIMALLGVMCAIPRVMTFFDKGEESTEAKTEYSGTCYLVDETGVFEKDIQYLKASYPGMNFNTIEQSEVKELEKYMDESRSVAILSIQEKEGIPVLEITVGNFLSKIQTDTIADACNKIWQSHLLTEKGLEKGEVDVIQTPLTYTQKFIGNMNLTEYVVGLLLTFVMFFAVYYYGYGVAMSISSEKTSRVMETLIISAKPSKILIGKCLAMGAVGLLQLGGLMAFAAFCYKFILPAGFQIAGVDLAISGFTPKTLVFLIIYFILGYALYAVMNSVCGAAVSKIEDLNSAMMPVSIIVIIGFYLGYFTSVMGGGSGTLSKLAVYLPISSPFAVPFKLITGEITMQEMGISILLLALAIVIVTMFSIRIYSASVMYYGNRLKWKELKKIKTN